MGLYGKYVLPRIIHLACSAKPNMRQRQKVVPLARGRVLEIGIGSGLNLPFYDSANVSGVWGLDPSREITRLASDAAEDAPFDVEFVQAGAEEIPFDSDSFDTVLLTYTLCSIPEAVPALREMARVLKPGGKLLFCEHGAAPDAGVRRWQDRIDPLWCRVAGGCHLNRPIAALIQRAGFRIERLESGYVSSPRIASYHSWGAAT